jgi:Fic family protein
LEWTQSSDGVHPVVRAAILHHEFESIHPFRDGNGRTGRALTPMVLRDWGYRAIGLAPLDFLIHRDRTEYYAQLSAVERSGRMEYSRWVEFFVRIAHEAYRDAVDRMLFQATLPHRFSARQRAIAEWFALWRRQDPSRFLKFNDIQHAFPEIPTRTLKRDLAGLREATVLATTGVLKGTRYRLRQVEPDAQGSITGAPSPPRYALREPKPPGIVTSHRCGSQCRKARSAPATCHCECGGANHGVESQRRVL